MQGGGPCGGLPQTFEGTPLPTLLQPSWDIRKQILACLEIGVDSIRCGCVPDTRREAGTLRIASIAALLVIGGATVKRMGFLKRPAETGHTRQT